jgi:hydroxymethylpyrimidine pyrophosphatase-like HAD family hydrolase
MSEHATLEPAAFERSAPRSEAPLLVTNLLNDLDTLASLLRVAIDQESWLNAFLVAAGMNQIAEDHLHQGDLSLPRVARHVRRVAPLPFGVMAAAAVRSFDATLWATRSLPVSERRTIAWQRSLGALLEELADAVVSPPSTAAKEWVGRSSAALQQDLARLPADLRRSIVRLPSCFRNFDQQPADLARLTDELASRWPDRGQEIAVVGVRTSGSYTAPLHGAFLRALGYRKVRVLTFRPGQRWRRHETKALEAAIRSGGLALVTDDAPKSGGSIAKTAAELERLGFAPKSILLAVQTLGETSPLPERLSRYPSVVLPWHEWSVHTRLDPQAVRLTLASLLGPSTEVRSVKRLPLSSPGPPRGHLQARYRVVLCDRSGGDPRELDVHAKGVGLGYFGEQALSVARPLQHFLPDVIGAMDGLLYRRWLPGSSRLRDIATGYEEKVAREVVDYAVSRAAALPVAEDVSLRLVDRGAVWQRAADILARAYGPAAQLARPLTHPLAKALLRVDRPSVIDGRMDLAAWFVRPESDDLDKIEFDEAAFNSLDVHCYDHVFDVAGVAPLKSDPAVAAALLQAYSERTGKTIAPERWLLYRLVHVAEAHRDEPTESVEAERAFARAMSQFYRATVFDDLAADPTGPVCGVDLDWALETRRLGFPSITPAGAFAIHALARHGYRVVLATGRSIGEVRERCRAYRLIGGVAEYGAAVFDARSGRVRDLLSAEDRDMLDAVRGNLLTAEGAVLDPAYGGSVRTFRFDETGRRRGLREETILTVLEAAGFDGRVRAIRGAYQTDFMVNTIDKGVGLRALANELGVEAADANAKMLALAFGDSIEDLPMMDLATRAAAPANADTAVRAAGIHIVGKPNQLGLAQSVAMLIGHRPGSCNKCRVIHLPAGSRLLLSALAAQDSRGLRKIFHAFGLAARVAQTAH